MSVFALKHPTPAYVLCLKPLLAAGFAPSERDAAICEGHCVGRHGHKRGDEGLLSEKCGVEPDVSPGVFRTINTERAAPRSNELLPEVLRRGHSERFPLGLRAQFHVSTADAFSTLCLCMPNPQAGAEDAHSKYAALLKRFHRRLFEAVQYSLNEERMNLEVI